MRRYPICVECGGEIDPRRFEGCERYYQTEDGPTCRDCFLTKEQEWMELNTDAFAALVGAAVVEVS